MRAILFLIAAITWVSAFSSPFVESNSISFRFNPSPSSSSSWQPLQQLPNLQEVKTFRIALKERNLDRLEELVGEISDPSSASFGKHLTLDKLKKLTRPSAKAVGLVKSWIESINCEYSLEANGGFITLITSLREVEKLTGCRFRTYNSTEGVSIVRSESPYWIPKRLEGIIEFIAPIHGFPVVTRQKLIVERGIKKRNDDIVDPVLVQNIRERYNITSPQSPLGVNNTQAVFEIQQTMVQSDLDDFLYYYAPELSGQKVKKYLGDLPNTEIGIGSESSLDVQYVMGIGAFGPTYIYSYNETDIYQAFLRYLADLSNDPRPPLVQSISWTAYGGDYPVGLVDRISREFMKLGMRGVSILVSSGDFGVSCDKSGKRFEPVYPTSPWVTFVGATDLYTSGWFESTEMEVGSYYSGGGFSDYWATPSWQKEAVKKFLKTPQPPAHFYNSSGRAYPDVSLVGTNFKIYMGGETMEVSGTSCSTPSFGGMVTLINGERLKRGKKSLGFLNPFLYKLASEKPLSFYDVTQGNNGYQRCVGFDAVKGFDPVTGLGTPNYPYLLRYALSLP